MAELPIRPLAGPRERTVPRTEQANFNQYIQDFKELIRAVAAAKRSACFGQRAWFSLVLF